MNKFLSLKLKFASLDWTFYGTWINLLMKHKFINFYWIVNNLIVRNNYLSLTKESIQKQLLTEQMFFEIGAVKNFAILSGKHLCWIGKLQACKFPMNIAKFLRTAFFIKHLQWRRRNRFFFLINTTEWDSMLLTSY